MTLKVRYASHPEDAKQYGTDRLREEFLIESIFAKDEANFTYSFYDRHIVGGAMPVDTTITLPSYEELKSEYFLDRREMGIINIGGDATITVDGTVYTLGFKEALYIGQGSKVITFASVNSSAPAKLYINSSPAHKTFPTRHVTLGDANVLQLGSLETSNERQINQLLVKEVVQTCQLQMGITALKPGSVWNTMPAHTHNRRMEAYFYFEVPAGQAICHFMGEPDNTRHIWMKNEQAVISPTWSIHSAAGTSNYSFIWGMSGENLDYTDMDIRQPNELK